MRARMASREKRRAQFILPVLLAALTAVISSSVARASVSPGATAFAFQCQGFHILIPSNTPTASQTNCNGSAQGAAAGGGKEKLYVAAAVIDVAKKQDGSRVFQNFSMYHIVSTDPCSSSDIFPPVGIGTADMFTNTRSPLGNPGSILAHLTFNRIGTHFLALLANVTAPNQNHWQGDTPTPPSSSNVGVVVAEMVPKAGQAFPDCQNPRRIAWIVHGVGAASLV